MTDIYGIKVWDANNRLLLDSSDKITNIVWSGTIAFPNDVSTGPNWPNMSNNNFNNATRYLEVESDAFLQGTPYVMYHDHNGKYTASGTQQMAGIRQVLHWTMLSPTQLRIIYAIFSPGWSQADIYSRYNNVPITVMVGIY